MRDIPFKHHKVSINLTILVLCQLNKIINKRDYTRIQKRSLSFFKHYILQSFYHLFLFNCIAAFVFLAICGDITLVVCGGGILDKFCPHSLLLLGSHLASKERRNLISQIPLPDETEGGLTFFNRKISIYLRLFFGERKFLLIFSSLTDRTKYILYYFWTLNSIADRMFKSHTGPSQMKLKSAISLHMTPSKRLSLCHILNQKKNHQRQTKNIYSKLS